jgi:dolichyl-phosphate-mannose-protein mannosyltransferase
VKYLLAAIIIVASIATHAAHWGFPNEVVFDEVYFGKFALAYQTHQYYFDVHPPLAKLLIGASAYLGGEHPGQDFETIGKPYTEKGYMYLRLLPILAGMLLPLVLFLLCLELGFSKMGAFFVGAAVILENSILTNSRFILTDNLLLLFGFAGLFFYFFAARQGRPKVRIALSIVSAALLAMSLSIKWTGATFLFLVLCIEFGKWSSHRKDANKKSLLASFLIFICIPFAIYYSVFADPVRPRRRVHVRKLPEDARG